MVTIAYAPDSDTVTRSFGWKLFGTISSPSTCDINTSTHDSQLQKVKNIKTAHVNSLAKTQSNGDVVNSDVNVLCVCDVRSTVPVLVL